MIKLIIKKGGSIICFLLFMSGLSSCGLYRDIQANANPVMDSSGTKVRGFTASASIGKNLADLDTLINTAQFTYTVNELSVSIAQKTYIDIIILNYSDLASYARDKSIKENKILADRKLLFLIQTRYPSARYTKLDLEHLSNEIQMIQSEIYLEDNSFSNRLIDFLENNGLKLPDIKLDSLFSAVDKSSSIDLTHKLLRVEYNNNLTEIRHQNLQNFLPSMGLSTYTSNDFYTLFTSATIGVSGGFSVSDIFKRNVYKGILESTNENLARQIILVQQESKNLSLLMEKRILYQENIIWRLEEQLKIRQKLINTDYDRFGTKKIDFHILKQRIDDVSDIELSLQKEKRKLFVLRKRFQYGIFNLEI